MAESKTDIIGGNTIDTRIKKKEELRLRKENEDNGYYKYNNNTMEVGVKGGMKEFYRRNL